MKNDGFSKKEISYIVVTRLVLPSLPHLIQSDASFHRAGSNLFFSLFNWNFFLLIFSTLQYFSCVYCGPEKGLLVFDFDFF